MTQEQLNDEINQYSVSDFTKQSLKELFKMFTDSNVVIPRGESPHPYADVLHEWIEDTSKVLEYRDSNLDVWNVTSTLRKANQYRIKPSEPVYEYQWYYFVNGKVNVYHAFMTIDEYNDGNKALKFSLNRFEETKRERQ